MASAMNQAPFSRAFHQSPRPTQLAHRKLHVDDCDTILDEDQNKETVTFGRRQTKSYPTAL